MNLSRELLVRLADASGFREVTLEKVIRLAEVLRDIARHPLLASALVLKGGTALNLFFGEPQRLSVDLDFNYVGNLSRAAMLEARPEVERAVSIIARAHGYHVQRSREAHAGRKMFLLYRSTTGARERIEVDLNFLHRLPLTPAVARNMWQPGDLERPVARLTGVEELAAGKLCALLDRSMPRDAFDAIRLPALLGERWRTRRNRRVFIAMAGLLPHPLTTYDRARLDRVTDKRVQIELWPTLSRSHTPTAEEMKAGAWSVVAPLLDLYDAEREYTERIQVGDFRPELLFPDDEEMTERLRRHPALLWKVENARLYAARRGSRR